MKFNWMIVTAVALGFGTSYGVAEAESKTPAEKLVTLGGSITETVVALGHHAKIVAVDTTSVYPSDVVSTLPNVGYVRKLSSEGILSLAPTMVIATSDAGPKIALDQVKSTGVKVEIVEKGHTVAKTKSAIQSLGKLLGEEKKAADLVSNIDVKLAEAKLVSEQYTKKPRILFIYARGARVLNVSGKNTSAHSVIELAGAENAFGNVEGYKPLTAEAVVAAQPDVILMLSRGVDSLGGEPKVLELPGLKLTPAGKNKRVVVMDDMKLLGFGPRLGDAVLELSKALKAGEADVI